QRHEDQVALGALGRLADCLRHFARLAVAEADAALLVADDDERGEAEATAALHHLGDAVDVNELVDETVVALLAVTIAIAAAFPTFLCHDPDPCSFPESTGFNMPGLSPGGENQKLRPASRAASASALTRP